MTAKTAKTRFGFLMDTAQREPVVITKHDREVAVVVSMDTYQRLIALEDELWRKKAARADKSGMIGKSKSSALIEELVHASD